MSSNSAEHLAKIERTRAAYLPTRIRTLFVGEAPPDTTERFFYFENVTESDGLYLYLMHALYGTSTDKPNTAELRASKPEKLRRFQRDGYYLIDALEHLPAGKEASQRTRELRAAAPHTVNRISELLTSHGDNDTQVVLIKATVFDALHGPALERGVPLAHDWKIPFPGSGQQKRFLEALRRLRATDATPPFRNPTPP